MSSTVGGVTTSYSYDVNGMRTGRSSGGSSTSFITDNNRDYTQVVAEITDGVFEKGYSFGDDLISQVFPGGNVFFYHYDGLGSTRSLSDVTGLFTDEYDYEAFGELTGSSGATDNDFLFAGEQFDSSLGQYYLRARYYDQGIGRFTQMDNFQGLMNDPVTLHKYLYGNVDPVNFVDPSGNVGLARQLQTLNIQSKLQVIRVSKVGQIGLTAANDATFGTATGLKSAQTGLLLLAATGAAGAKLFDILSEKSDADEEETRNLSRAVEDPELASLYECNCFVLGRNAFPKQFFNTDAEAIKFGNRQILDKSGLDRFHLVKARISSILYVVLDHAAFEPNIGPIITVPNRLLPAFNSDVEKHGGWRFGGTFHAK